MLIPKGSRLTILLIISLFVYADIICENVLVIVNDQQSYVIATAFLFGFLILQVFFASIQSGLSDFFGRRKSLILSFSVSIFCILCAYLYTRYSFHYGLFLNSCIGRQSAFGKYNPNFLCSNCRHTGKNYRRSFALASSTYSLAFITLIIIDFFSTYSVVHMSISTAILLISLITCMFVFEGHSRQNCASST